MLIFSLFNSPLTFLFVAISILAGFTIHEFFHALVADKLGDDTPRSMGRLTLNPLVHMDLLGTVFLLLAGFGWGKPVIVNPNNFENPKFDNLTVSLAGPISNLALAGIAGLIYRFTNLPALLESFLIIFVFYNLVLMIFNFLPIPPLDGSKILSIFLPEEVYNSIQQYGTFLLFGLIIFSSFVPVIPFIMTRVVGFFFSLITGQSPLI